MKVNRSSLLSDIAFLVLLVLCNVCVAFTAGDPNKYVENLIFLNLAFFFVIVTYFTTVTAGLILNIVFIFGYGTYILYETVTRGETIGVSTYFWLIMTPVLTVVIWLFTTATRQLQAENDDLQKQKARLATLDERTDLKNSIAFRKDANVFAGISTRYNIPLTLLVIKVKYWNEIRPLIGDEQLAEAIIDVSKISQASIRTNDALYLLDKEDATWGLLLFTDRDGVKVVMERIKQSLEEFNTREFAQKYKVDLSLKMGAIQYQAETIQSPIDFIVQAKKQLEYDV
ncbi:diguanylate cyclase domain-containing protein [Paenibacillus chitinolyticus]|uniref:diguanylate cyclase domain-containing protein n=1 Tax=Paenibacillus chitinolyticus TaxID=79263 RepID=UPI0026E4D9F6|nr:diguanylate cyclase [Paenibacillus chitinolyticus]GKS11662.1 GGDEF domain-containing protein [Paenibacillus chitinolyticus]